jgi:hypothetical protein
MLEVRLVDAAKAVPQFWGFSDAQLPPSSWETYCREKGCRPSWRSATGN